MGTGTGAKRAKERPLPVEGLGRNDNDAELLRRIRNLDSAAQRVHRGWEELLNLNGFQVAPSPKQYEQLFTHLMRVAVYPVGEDKYGRLESWGHDPVCELSPTEWLKWYTRVCSAFTRPRDWHKQQETITFLAVNYWNGLIKSESGQKIFAPWLRAELTHETGDANAPRRRPSELREPLSYWQALRDQYAELTRLGALELASPWPTANNYLFSQAPRKRAVGWCFRANSSIRSFDPRDLSSLLSPPVMSGQISERLRVAKPLAVFSRKINEAQFHGYCGEIKSATGGPVWKLAIQRFSDILEALDARMVSTQERDAEYPRLRSMRDLVRLLREKHLRQDSAGSSDGASTDDEALADYLVHLCVYLNTSFFPRESAALNDTALQRRILRIDQCAFMARTLREYYGGNTVAYPDKYSLNASYFYSIPVFVPAWKTNEKDAARTSILGMGTSHELHPDEIRGWLHVAEQLVLPAQQQDVITDERLDDARMHLDAVIHAWRWDLRKVSADVSELNRFTDESCDLRDEHVKRVIGLRGHIDSSLESGFRRSDLLQRVLHKYKSRGTNPPHHIAPDGFRFFDKPETVPLGWFPLRYIALEALLRGLSTMRETLQAEIREPYALHTLGDEWMEQELMRVDPETTWSVQVPAFNGIYVDWPRNADPAASWALILEEWASNVRKHRLLHASTPSWARLYVKDIRPDVLCELACGPSRDKPGPDCQEGHGLCLIRLCAEALAGRRVTPTYSPDHQYPDEAVGSWCISFRLPTTRWEELCRS